MVFSVDDSALRAMFENLLDAVLFTHPSGAIFAANPAACALFGATEEQMCASGRQPLMDTSDERWPVLLAEREATGRVHGRARMRRISDGALFECEMSSSVFPTDDGSRRACVILRDVSEQSRLVAGLARAERLWRLTVDSAPTGIALARLDGRWLYVNPALSRMLGYDDPEELIDMTFPAFTHPDDLDVTMNRAARLVVGDIDSYTLEKRFHRKDGSYVWGRISVAIVTNEYGEPVHYVTHIEDISAQRATTEQLVDMASRDPLTQLTNRMAFMEAVSAVPATELFALAFVDLDGFKSVNDELGHALGDELLITVAERLCAEVRPLDVVGRLGGDEFAILIRQVEGVGEASHVAERMLAAVRKPYSLRSGAASVTCSIGLAMADRDRDAERLLVAADVAMYAAKRAGKNAYRIGS
jgi:diguanylate cyclase (GGDEF)-like protein/PAS domain S-box-containing protein